MLGMDTDKFIEGADALVRMADALERLADVAERVLAEEDGRDVHVHVSRNGSWLDAEGSPQAMQ